MIISHQQKLAEIVFLRSTVLNSVNGTSSTRYARVPLLQLSCLPVNEQPCRQALQLFSLTRKTYIKTNAVPIFPHFRRCHLIAKASSTKITPEFSNQVAPANQHVQPAISHPERTQSRLLTHLEEEGQGSITSLHTQ